MQQLAQGRRASLVQGGSEGHLDSFHVQLAAFGAILKDQSQQTAYFVRDFLLDRFRCFFSCGVRVSSTGRARQIFSFTSSSV